MTTILLIRHGESQANRKNIFAGHLDIELEEQGVLQAQKTARYIAENYKVDKVYASDLKRAYETGKALADLLGLPITADKDLREIDGGEWDEKNFDTLDTLFPEDFGLWRRDLGKAKCTGGESVAAVGERVMAAVTRIAEENAGKTVAIATHATPIRTMQCLVDSGTMENMKNYEWVSNASVSEFTYENGMWKIVEMSHDAHMGDMRTALPEGV